MEELSAKTRHRTARWYDGATKRSIGIAGSDRSDVVAVSRGGRPRVREEGQGRQEAGPSITVAVGVGRMGLSPDRGRESSRSEPSTSRGTVVVRTLRRAWSCARCGRSLRVGTLVHVYIEPGLRNEVYDARCARRAYERAGDHASKDEGATATNARDV